MNATETSNAAHAGPALKAHGSENLISAVVALPASGVVFLLGLVVAAGAAPRGTAAAVVAGCVAGAVVGLVSGLALLVVGIVQRLSGAAPRPVRTRRAVLVGAVPVVGAAVLVAVVSVVLVAAGV